jgi:SAM-dependent methyltransferase
MSSTADWSHGYVTDVIYSDNSYREMSPSWINYVAALNGCYPIDLSQPFSYVELGCGLGRTVAHLAAAFPRAHFIGVDFNPAHIDSAIRHAAELGISNVRFLERSFEDLTGETNARNLDLPDVDFVALHGVYSWVGLADRQAIQRFIYERLKPGGLVYNSYNCLPGWSPEAPLRRLIVELCKTGAGNSEVRIGHALKELGSLAKLDLGYLSRHPAVRQALEQYQTRPANYLAHEMLNAAWNLFYSADVADEMSAAKLDFLGSAALAENHLEMLFPDEAIAHVTAQPDPRLRQLMQDFVLNQRFRRDLFVRGHARLTAAQIHRHREDQLLMAMRPLAKVEPKIKVPRGFASVDPGLLASLDELLKSGSAKVSDLAGVALKGGRIEDFLRVVALLTAGHVLAPAARPYRNATPPSDQQALYLPVLHLPNAVNARLLHLATEQPGAGGKPRPLVSQVTGGTLQIGVVSAIILNGLLAGGSATEVAARALAILDRNGFTLRKDDQPITEPTAKLVNLTELTTTFIAQELPVLMAAGIVEGA